MIRCLNELIVTDGVTLLCRVSNGQIEDVLGNGQLVFQCYGRRTRPRRTARTIIRLNIDDLPSRENATLLLLKRNSDGHKIMAFLTSEQLRKEIEAAKLIAPYSKDRIKQGAYELQ